MNPYSIYKSRVPVQSPREQEATALRLASRLLTEAGNRLDRNRALNINHGIWSILFRELTGPSCPLPEILRKDCLHLAVWSLDYSTRAVLSDLPLSPLAEVNTRVAEGLETPQQLTILPEVVAQTAVGIMASAGWA